MKYSDVDMQDVPSQPPLQAQPSENGTSDRGIRRSRPSDTTSNINSSSSKAGTPEVIDLDGEDSPMENEEVPLHLNGVTTVKKVSMPWQRGGNLSTVDKKPSESSVESSAADCPTTEKGCVASKELSTPAEADEAVKNHAADGRFRLKKLNTKDSHKIVKKTSISKKDEKVVEVKKKLVGTKLPSSKHQGERKRPSLPSTDESDPKRPKIDNGAKNRVPSAKVSQKDSDGKESPKPSPRDSSEVSVVDLVEDDDEQERVSQSKDQDKSTASVGPAKVDVQATSDNRSSVVASGKSDSPVPRAEKKAPSVAPASITQAVVSVQNSSAVTSPSVSSEEKRTSLSAIISSGKNGFISPMQSIEVKKVKLCPQLEKQATAMSPLPLTPAVATPKQSTAASLVQIPVSITASTPEAAEIPSVASSKAVESAKEVVKEAEVISGAELEKKKGLNLVHSETRKMVKKLTRSELESFFLELACELIISKSDAGRYRQLYEEMKESCENKANKVAHLHKQLVDLSAVVQRTVNDSKEKRDTIPAKITRSVGLQLEQSQIFAAMKNRSREERCYVPPPSSSSSNSSVSASSSDRVSSAKYGRTYTPSKTTPPSTPNGLIGSAAAKDLPPGVPALGKSPQRQLKALHPRSSPTATQGNPRPPSNPSPSTPALAQSLQDAASKRLGFIDIADEKIGASAQIGIRRHMASAVIVTSASSSTQSSATAVSAVSSTQVMTPTLKVLPPQFGRPATTPGNTFPTAGGNTRVVTTAAIPVTPGTSISSPRLTYIIPTSSPIAVQPRQLVLQTAAQSQQIRGRSPVTTMPAMIMRPNTTLVQVQAGSITTTPPTLIRAVQPSSAQQMLVAAKTTTQPQPSRILGMTHRPSPTPSKVLSAQHPAPLPAQPQPTVVNSNLKPIPRRPVLKLSKVMNGIVLSWNMTQTTPHEEIASYQLYAYQEGANAPPSPSLWKKVGDVKALPLPMACTLTQFADGHTYHFAVRAVDVHGRVGEFSVPGTIALFS